MHEAGQTEEPGGWDEVVTVTVGLTDDELSQVDDEAGEVTDEEHDHNTDENTGQVDFIVRGAVSVGANMSIPLGGKSNQISFQTYNLMACYGTFSHNVNLISQRYVGI